MQTVHFFTIELQLSVEGSNNYHLKKSFFKPGLKSFYDGCYWPDLQTPCFSRLRSATFLKYRRCTVPGVVTPRSSLQIKIEIDNNR